MRPVKGADHMSRLSARDVAQLLQDPSEEVRAKLAEKVAGQAQSEELSDSEREIALKILDQLANDVADHVRAALAEAVKANPDLPHDLALKLAEDIEKVSLPILKDSTVLTDEDLVRVVRGGSPEKQTAVAGRPAVSATVSQAVAEFGVREAVSTLVENQGADLDEASCDHVVNRFASDEGVCRRLVERSDLPLSIADRLVEVVSSRLRETLMQQHHLPHDLAEELAVSARERAILGMSAWASDEEVRRLVDDLHSHGALSQSMMIRAACLGELRFVEYALAKIANVPAKSASALLYDKGPLGLRAIVERAGLSERIVPVLRTAADVFVELEFDGQTGDRLRFRQRMVERILTQYADVEGEDLDYLIAQLSRRAA